MAVKYGVKSIEGIKDSEGNAYELEKDEAGLSEESINDLFNLEQNEALSMVCLGLLRGVPDSFTNPFTGEPLEGVSIVKESAGKKK